MPSQVVHLTNVTCPVTVPPTIQVLGQTEGRQGHTQPPERGEGRAGLGAGYETASPHRLTLSQAGLACPVRGHVRAEGGLHGHLAQTAEQ